MYRIHQLKLPINHDPDELKQAVISFLGIPEKQLVSYSIFKRSIDARNKAEIHYVYAIDVELDSNLTIKQLKHFKANELSIVKPFEYRAAEQGVTPLSTRPVVIGLGPAGLFCGYLLALSGYKPVCYERGQDAETRLKDIEDFFAGSPLKPESNILFGEGGAGTFSDGKLNTLIKDRDGKGRFVLETFVKFGANEEILYDAKPHIGTDKLINIVKAMREEIIALGGEVHFGHKLENLEIKDGRLVSITVNGSKIQSELCIIATGHSARDTFAMLYDSGTPMEPKAFAIGVRAVHKQSLIDKNQYGNYAGSLPAASYKLTHTCKNGRSVYSFCMCPGGYVVNASSEEGGTIVNGMSYSGRDSGYANAAIICNVTPEDYEKEGFGKSPLSGVEFQRKYETLAYINGKGNIPAQRFGEFISESDNEKKNSYNESCTEPSVKGKIHYTNVRACLPDYVGESIAEAIETFDRKIHGFGNPDTLLLGVETRTSSPVRILRNDDLQSEAASGLFPCGEGAGYAGGIMSAALDGMKVAEKIISTFSSNSLE